MPLPKIADLLVQLRAAVREFGGDQRISEMPTGPLPDDPYLLDKPRIIGASKQALVVTETENGIKLSLVTKDGTPDVHRAELMKRYSKRKKDWAAFSAQQEKRINDSSSD
jgi:hypothetical protein